MADGPDKTDELYPIAVLIDELKVPTFCCALWRGATVGAFAHGFNSMMMSFYDLTPYTDSRRSHSRWELSAHEMN
jgi:hypothetical protein